MILQLTWDHGLVSWPNANGQAPRLSVNAKVSSRDSSIAWHSVLTAQLPFASLVVFRNHEAVRLSCNNNHRNRTDSGFIFHLPLVQDSVIPRDPYCLNNDGDP